MAAYDDYNDNEYESYSEEDEIPIPAIRRFDSNIPLILNGVDCMEEIMENFEFVFEQRYGETRPVFHRGSLAEASRAAFKAPSLQKRPLALYLHKEETDQDQCFPFRVMTNKAVVNLLRKNFVLWGWDVTSQKNKEKLERLMAEADMRRIYREIEQMDPTKFPMLIIIEAPCWVHEIVEKIQVSNSADEVRAVLLKRLNIAVEAKNMENFNFLRDALRDEQREEYEKTLALDKAKMEERLKQELAEKEKKEKEAEEKAAKERREKEKQVLAEEKQAELPEEPKTTDPDTVTVRVRLPGGKAENRIFRFTEEVRLLLTYVESLGFPMTSHNVFNSDRPKKNVADFDLEKTFAEVKWPKREMVFVEEKF